MLQGITEHPQGWRFPAGLPLPGPAVPSPSHAPAQPLLGPLLCPPSIPVFLQLPKSTLGSVVATFSSLSLRSCFSITSDFCQWLCSPFPETPEAQPRVEVFGCVFLTGGFSKSCLFLETPTRDVSTGQGMALVGGKLRGKSLNSWWLKPMRSRLDLLGTSWGCGASVSLVSGSSDGTLGGRNGEDAAAPLLERAAVVSSWQMGLEG